MSEHDIFVGFTGSPSYHNYVVTDERCERCDEVFLGTAGEIKKKREKHECASRKRRRLLRVRDLIGRW